MFRLEYLNFIHFVSKSVHHLDIFRVLWVDLDLIPYVFDMHGNCFFGFVCRLVPHSLIDLGGGEHAPPPQGPPGDGQPPPGQNRRPPPPPPEGGPRSDGLTGFLQHLLDQLHLDHVDTGDLLLLVLLFFLFREDADEELLVALGLLLIL